MTFEVSRPGPGGASLSPVQILSSPASMSRPPRPTTTHQYPTPALDDEPPPAYTPSATDNTQLLESGPQYPFGPTQASFPPAPSSGHPSGPHHHFPPPPTHPSLHQPHQPQWQAPVIQHNQQYPHPPNTWPQQSYPPQPPGNYSGTASYTSQPQPGPSSTAPQPFIPSASQFNNQWPDPREPTKVPTGGRPLLWDDRVLIYPPSGTFFCSKCCNTGYKGFDPSRPCRKCWEKYGKLWSVVRLAPASENLNIQRPLPPVPSSNGQPPPPLHLVAGDPRIGGRLCWNCGGTGVVDDGSFLGMLFSNTDRCRVCMGAGRTF